MLSRRENKPLDCATLVPMFGGIEKKARQLDREVVTLGRARGSDICLDGNEVSALHCIIFRGSDGYRVRDCGSRTGTRINGQSVKNALLGNGDILQIGPFSFETRIPKAMELQSSDAVRLERLRRSRARLGQMALRLRRKLRHFSGNSRPLAEHPAATELSERAGDLKAKIRQYDQRLNQLEQSEQELLQEKDDLEKLRQEFQRQVKLSEADLARRRREMDEEFQQRWEAVQQELENLRRSRGLSSHDAPGAPGAAELAKQQQELEARRTALEQEAQALRAEREAAKAAAQELHGQRAQLSGMIEEIKGLQQAIRNQAAEDASAYQAEIDQLRCERDAALQGQTPTAELLTELAALRQENQALRERGSEPAAEIERLREENQTLRGLAEEFQQHFLNHPSTNDESLAALQADNASLRAALEQAVAPANGEALEEARQENQVLRRLLDEAEASVKELRTASSGDSAGELEAIRKQKAFLEELLHTKDQLIEGLKQEVQKSEVGDPDCFEAELNRFRKELEADRVKMNREIESLRQRNQELDEATREMEMEMSRERAELARERMRLDRMREEVKVDMERLQREQDVRGSLAPVQKLREELMQRADNKRPAAPDRPRTMRNLP